MSDAQRKFITDLTLAHESAAETTKPRFQALRKKTMAWYESKGIKAIEMKGADRERWLATAKKAAWDEVIKRSPGTRQEADGTVHEVKPIFAA